jgi:glucokinase
VGREAYILLGDIGGSHARFALVAEDGGELIAVCSLAVTEHATLVDAVRAYLARVGRIKPLRGVLAIALPVTGDRLRMTNHDWVLSVAETREALGLECLRVINDYTALALALPLLSDSDCTQIGPGSSLPGYPRAVLGPGTGLGVSAAIPVGERWVPLQSEGGHVSYGPLTAREQCVIEVLRETCDHVSAEALVSGPGLASIHAALSRLDGANQRLAPEQISRLALAGGSPIAVEALSMFCGILGTVAGNLALTLGARGGVYIGGGIAPQIRAFLQRSNFRDRFEDHGRFTIYLREIPTYLIDTEYAALAGAALARGELYDDLGVCSRAAGAA